MKKLIMMSAAAGTGKSTYIREYMEKHGKCDVISSDETRRKLVGSYDDFSTIPNIQKLVFEDFWKQSAELVKKDNCVVFIDCTCLYNNLRRRIIANCPGYDCYELVMIHKPLETILKQNQMREKSRIVPEEIIISMWENFEMPDEETSALFSKITFIDEKGEHRLK